jgi:hypothetical protein
MTSTMLILKLLLLFSTSSTIIIKLSRAAADNDNDNNNDYYIPGIVANKVFMLRRDNFKIAIEDPANPVWLLKFYAPWYVKKIFFN